MPSSGVSISSVAKPRIVRVAGTTISSLMWPAIVSRVSISTGRRLSGLRNVYHRISPRSLDVLPTFSLPGERLLVGRKLVRARGRSSVGRRVLLW